MVTRRFFIPASNLAFLRAPCTLPMAMGDVVVEACLPLRPRAGKIKSGFLCVAQYFRNKAKVSSGRGIYLSLACLPR